MNCKKLKNQNKYSENNTNNKCIIKKICLKKQYNLKTSLKQKNYFKEICSSMNI